MRKLATIQRITALTPIQGAEFIEAASILGWTVVVKKGDFAVGDLCVYYEIDSFLSAEDPRYASFEERFITWEGKRGMRLKTIKLRKQLSEGLALRIEQFPEIKSPSEGNDVTEILKVEKWERPEEAASNAGGNQRQPKNSPFPFFIPKTDQNRVQNVLHVLKSHEDETFEVSIKLDGSSMTVYYVDHTSPRFGEIKNDIQQRRLKGMGAFRRMWTKLKWGLGIGQDKEFSGLCSRNFELDIKASNHFSDFARKHGLLERLENAGQNIAIQGELLAPSIQSNHEKVSDFEFYVYDVYNIDEGVYEDPVMARFYADLLGLNYVPVLERDVRLSKFHDTADARGLSEAILSYAEGPGMNKGVKREGVVFKSNTTGFSFKAISTSYLLNKG